MPVPLIPVPLDKNQSYSFPFSFFFLFFLLSHFLTAANPELNSVKPYLKLPSTAQILEVPPNSFSPKCPTVLLYASSWLQ